MNGWDANRSLRSVVAVALVSALYVLSRGPFYLQPLMGEEGIFAHLLARSPAGPGYGLLGRVHGREIYDPLRHPALMYEAYTRWGACLRWLSRSLGNAPGAGSDLWARMAHSAFQGALWACLAWRLAQAHGRGLTLLVMVALVGLSSPLGVSASIYLQTDTSTGLLLAGLLAFSLAESDGPWAARTALFAVGLVGKQEWSVAALLGLGMAEGAYALRSQGPPDVWRMAWRIASLVLGNLCSFWFDPLNYMGGLNVLGGISPGHQLMVGGQGELWFAMWPVRRDFLLSLGALLLPASFLAWAAPAERRQRELAACAMAWAFSLPFLLSTWNNSPRYFAPGWGAGLACLASQVAGRRPSAKVMALAIAAALAVVLWQARFLGVMLAGNRSMTEYPLSPVAATTRWQEIQAARANGGCVPRLSSSYAWARGMDFVGDAMDGESSAALVVSHGGAPCP